MTDLKITAITAANANSNPVFASAFSIFNHANADFQSAFATPAETLNWETFSEPGDAIADTLAGNYAFTAIGAYIQSGLTVYLIHSGTFL